ncbi:MAG: zinc ABC transporter substrate-binding protein [Alphaproteobacteria bacterium]
MKRDRSWRFLTLVLASAGYALAATNAAGEPRVVATIKPVHALVAGVMESIGKPVLLIEGAGSPHAYAMRPSDARALSEAELIVWVGPEFETFLVKPLEAFAPEAGRLTLADITDLVLLPARRGGAWATETEGGAAAGSPGPLPSPAQDVARTGPEGNGRPPSGEPARDLHIWLDPLNARQIVRAVATALTALDPANADAYRGNAGVLEARLKALDEELDRELAGVRSVAYVVFHDAYRYFEHRYGMNVVAAVTVSPDQPPGARRVREVRRKLREVQARCVFHEPQFRPRLIRTLVEGMGAAIGVLDPLGAKLTPGPDLYFTLMRSLAANLKRCLSAREP